MSFGVHYLARFNGCWGRQLLWLVDSLVTVGYLRRNRFRSGALMKQIQRTGANALGLDMRTSVRWMPTWRNYASGPSHVKPFEIVRKNQTNGHLRRQVISEGPA